MNKRFVVASQVITEAFEAIKNIAHTYFKKQFKLAGIGLENAIDSIARKVANNFTEIDQDIMHAGQKLTALNKNVKTIGKDTGKIVKTAVKVVNNVVSKKVKTVEKDVKIVSDAVSSVVQSEEKVLSKHVNNAVADVQQKGNEKMQQLHTAEDSFANTLANEINREIAPSSSLH